MKLQCFAVIRMQAAKDDYGRGSLRYTRHFVRHSLVSQSRLLWPRVELPLRCQFTATYLQSGPN